MKQLIKKSMSAILCLFASFSMASCNNDLPEIENKARLYMIDNPEKYSCFEANKDTFMFKNDLLWYNFYRKRGQFSGSSEGNEIAFIFHCDFDYEKVSTSYMTFEIKNIISKPENEELWNKGVEYCKTSMNTAYQIIISASLRY